MNFVNAHFVRGVIFIFCFGHVKNEEKIKSNGIDDISDVNSDIFLNSYQLLIKYGYSVQNHTVTTDDGYKVNLIRIPKNGPPVLLVHGIGDSSDSWLVLGPSYSMAYVLSDLNYDVWIYNARGNKYSKGHVGNVSVKGYWNFSFEEMGSKDLPAAIDYILSTTSETKLSYVGFSQGTTIFFVLCSLMPEYNAKIGHAILLAPITTIKGTNYPFIQFLGPNLNLVSRFFDDINLYETFADNKLINLYHASVCRDGATKKFLCELEYLLNYGIKNLGNIYRVPVVASHVPAGVSTKTFVHYIQSYVSEQFARFDYGPVRNRMVYSSLQPPKYDLSLVSAPLYLFISEVDWFSRIDNIEEAMSELRNVRKYVILNKSLDFTHLEFVYGSRVKTIINDPVISILANAT